jgi:hypothetical protein
MESVLHQVAHPAAPDAMTPTQASGKPGAVLPRRQD